jgi:hypothetical protein
MLSKLLLESAADYVYTVKVEQGHAIATSHTPGCVAVTGYTAVEYAADLHLWYWMIYEEDRTSDRKQVEETIKQQVQWHGSNCSGQSPIISTHLSISIAFSSPPLHKYSNFSRLTESRAFAFAGME